MKNQAPEVILSSQKSKPNIVIWIMAGVTILVLGIVVGLTLGKYLPKQITSYEDCMKAKGSSVQESNPPTCVTADGLSFKGSFSSPSPTPTPDPAANWKIYTIEKFGIQFKIPEQLSTLGDLDIKECAGEKGMEFSATLPSNKSSGSLISIVYAGGGCAAHNLFSIGTVSSDYEAGRSKRFTDTNGYYSKTGTYYCVGPSAVRNDEIPSHLVKEIVSKNGVPLLRIIGEDESYGTWPKLCTPGSGKIGAFVNLSNNKTFPGIALQMDLTDQLSENLFDQILSTIKFTNK